MNYCKVVHSMENVNFKVNKCFKHVGKLNQGSLTKLDYSLVEQSLKQTNIKGWTLKYERIWKVWKSAVIKIQMLSEFDPTENGTSSMKSWQNKMQI